MLLGRTGLWMLKSPFTKHASNGLMGEIVTAGFIQDIVAKGQDVKTNTYAPVGGEALYSADLSKNCIILTIDSGGRYYSIPDKYIENLYDGEQNFRYHYMTAKVGMLPVSFDMTEACGAMAKSISEATGMNVKPKDIYVSVSDEGGLMLSDEEAEYATLKRLADIEDNDSIYNQLNNADDLIDEMERKLNDVSDAYVGLFD